MGFGFNLFFIFILLPLTVIFLLLWIITGKKLFGGVLGVIWLPFVALIILLSAIHFFTAPKELSKEDYYGEYIIDRKFFRGSQADWQYNTFHFEIKPNDSIYFYVTDKQKILRIYKGSMKTTTGYVSEKLIVNMDTPTHHIMMNNPTTYRSAWSFYLVFHSDKFNNVFFRKGKWKPLSK